MDKLCCIGIYLAYCLQYCSLMGLGVWWEPQCNGTFLSVLVVCTIIHSVTDYTLGTICDRKELF